MSGALEASVTLEDVFAVVSAKRVPLAPELAGYLSLEIAEGASSSIGEIDPRFVYIGEEGTVALVRPRRDAPAGDAESSLRAILGRLLDASGSLTPALAAAARRPRPIGMAGLVEELEAALIPVNRAAGRRALARLAREVKRVTLGVGRNAPARSSSPSYTSIREDSRGHSRPPPADESPTSRREGPSDLDRPGAAVAPSPVSVGSAGSPGNAGNVPRGGNALPSNAPGATAATSSASTPPPAYEAARTQARAERAEESASARAGDVAPPPAPISSSDDVLARGTHALVGQADDAPVARSMDTSLGRVPDAPDLDEPPRLPAIEVPFGKSARDAEDATEFDAGIPEVQPDGSAEEGAAEDLFVDEAELPTSEFRKDAVDEAHARLPKMPDVAESEAEPADVPEMDTTEETPARPVRDEVDHLLDAFGVSQRGEENASRELKALVGLEPTPPPPGSEDVVFTPEAPPVQGEHDVESLLALSDPTPPVAARSAPAFAPQSPPTAILPALANEPVHADPSSATARASRRPSTRASVSPVSRPDEHAHELAETLTPESSTTSPTSPSLRRIAAGEFAHPRAPREGRVLALTLLAFLLAGAGAVWVFMPAFFTGHAPIDTSGRPPSNATSLAPPSVVARCKAALVVTDVPQDAEVLLRVGQAPVDVERMPVGARLEFVATAEGFAPKRTVVPAGAPWDPGPDGKPRYEVAVQLDKSRSQPGGVDRWPAGEPGSEVGGKGAPGTVHIVSTPRGAEVWLLAALGPEARVDQLKCGSDVDLLIAGPTTLRRRLKVPWADFKTDGGGASVAAGGGGASDPTATVSASKSPR